MAACFMNTKNVGHLGISKRPILDEFKKVKNSCEPSETCPVLAGALMYIPEEDLKKAQKKALQRGLLGEPSQELRDFISDLFNDPML